MYLYNLNKTSTNAVFNKLIATTLVILALLFSGYNDLLPWQRIDSSIGKQQYSRVKNGTLFAISETSGKHGSLMGIERDGVKRYAGTRVDDPGYEMLIGVLSIFGINVSTLHDLGVINYSIVWVAILFMTTIIFYLSRDMLTASITFFIQIIFFKYSYPYLYRELVDQHGLVYPLSVIGLGTSIVYLLKIKKSHFLQSMSASLSVGIIIGLIALFRNSVGYSFLIGTIVSLIIMMVECYRRKIAKRNYYILASIIFLVIGYKITYIYTQKIFHYQTKMTLGIEGDLPQATYHTVWHSMFVGLGFYQNSWGIKWSDASGQEFANKTAPGIKYLSEAYFTIMQKLYFRYMFEHPFEYLRNHIKKITALMRFTLSAIKIPILLLGIIILFKLITPMTIFNHVNLDYRYFLVFIVASALVPILTHYRFSANFITLAFYSLMMFVIIGKGNIAGLNKILISLKKGGKTNAEST